ncbi:unnamed protein product, partial [Effrenium voratum]
QTQPGSCSVQQTRAASDRRDEVPVARFRRLMRWPFCPADARGKRLTIGFLLGTLVAFLLLLVLSFAMFHAFRTVATTGGILTPDESQVAGVGEAVDLCGFLDPAFSSVEDLHRVQDVAFSANGAPGAE